MRNHKLTALLLAATLTASLCAGTVLADDTPDVGAAASAGLLISPAPNSHAPTGDTASSAPETTLGGTIITNHFPVPDDNSNDAPGTLSFRNLEERMGEHNLNILSLDASMEAIEAIDYKEMASGLKMAIRMLEQQQSQIEQLVQGTEQAVDGILATLEDETLAACVSGLKPALTAYPQGTVASLSSQIKSYKTTLMDVQNGKLEEETDATLKQLSNTKRQVILGGQTLYITLLGLDQTAQSLQRQLAALDRTLTEMELRYEMGQISSLTLAEVKAGRTSLLSGIQTLDMNRAALKRQLEAMVGADITGTIQLQPLTAVTGEQLAAMDLKKDLEHAMNKSYSLYAARKAVSDADDDLDAAEDNPAAADYEIDSAEYALEASELSLEAAEQSFQLDFTSLYHTVHDQKQVLDAACTALAVKQDTLAAAQLKYQQGTISRNKLLEAQDALDAAQDTVDTAAVDLFTAYNNYRWAVEHGILN